jgi:Flp pilus assembly protein protease CpaA
MVGAGDVKYLAAFGAVIGAGQIWPALALVAVAGGILALLWTLAIGRTSQILHHSARLGLYCLSLGFLGSRRILSDVKDDAGTTPIPLGVAIAVGCTLVWFI